MIQNNEIGRTLIIEWLKAWDKQIAGMAGQDIRRVKDMEQHLIETIKYGSKIFTCPEMKKGINSKSKKIYARALYNILKAFDGKHLLATYGFKLPDEVNDKDNIFTQITNGSELVYEPSVNDWVNHDTGPLLTRYSPSFDLKILMTEIDNGEN